MQIVPRQTVRLVVVIAGAFVSLFPLFCSAQGSPFSDVGADSSLGEAVSYLHERGIVAGYADGTFRPNQLVNRAEAMKLLLAPALDKAVLAKLTSTPFVDVQSGAWYLPYVEAARQKRIIDGPPVKSEFFGTQAVKKMEYIKMLLLASSADPSAYGEVLLPLSVDVTDPGAWYYPYLRYAIASSITMVSKEGTLDPGRELTRGDTALLLYRYLMYRDGRRTQALLSETESEIIVVLGMLESNNIEEAEFASARGLLAARGANASSPDQPLVQGALKIAEAFRAIVRGYRAGINKQYDEAIRLAGESWNLADRSKQLSSSLENLAKQVQELSSKLAESARAAKAVSAR